MLRGNPAAGEEVSRFLLGLPSGERLGFVVILNQPGCPSPGVEERPGPPSSTATWYDQIISEIDEGPSPPSRTNCHPPPRNLLPAALGGGEL